MGRTVPANAAVNGENDKLRELITGLSRQVLQVANNSATGSGSFSGNNQNSLSRLFKIDFPKFGGEDVQG